MKKILLVAMALSLSACGGKKTILVPQPYMPDPPSVLMQEPQELSPIKNKGVLENEELIPEEQEL